ncbi:hypothetical protein DL769_007851 [Monosporascus sp. CRB-8-3]|nr:hypothetical protein DL769_007851 [Monosporascus sp. CRB-8-3]
MGARVETSWARSPRTTRRWTRGPSPAARSWKTSYTGIWAGDWMLTFMVAAFLPNAAGSDGGVRLQQSYPFPQFGTVVGLLAVKASRAKNRRRILSFTLTFAFFYKLLDGAVICPLWLVAYTLTSARKTYFLEGRDISSSRAEALHHPDPRDVLVDLLVFLFPSLLPASPPASPDTPVPGSESGDLKYLRRLYRVLFVTAVLGHIATTAAVPTSASPQLGLGHMFLPSRGCRMPGSGQAMHWVFRWDLYGIFGSALVRCPPWGLRPASLLGVREVAGPVPIFALVCAVAVALLPGSALAATLYWREEKLALLDS